MLHVRRKSTRVAEKSIGDVWVTSAIVWSRSMQEKLETVHDMMRKPTISTTTEESVHVERRKTMLTNKRISISCLVMLAWFQKDLHYSWHTPNTTWVIGIGSQRCRYHHTNGWPMWTLWSKTICSRVQGYLLQERQICSCEIAGAPGRFEGLVRVWNHDGENLPTRSSEIQLPMQLRFIERWCRRIEKDVRKPPYVGSREVR